MKQDRHRAENEDLESKAMIPLTQVNTPPGKAGQPTIDERSLDSSP